MSIYSIYKVTNLVNHKIYIGLTTQKLSHRIADHKCAHTSKNTCLYKAMRKYGFDNFKFEIIFSLLEENLEDLRFYESHFVKEYDCCILDGRNRGYNMTRGGEFFSPEAASMYNRERVAKGTHIFQTDKFRELRKAMLEEKIKNGTHNFQGEVQSNRVRAQNATQRTCPHCSKVGLGPGMLRYHFDKCKFKQP